MASSRKTYEVEGIRAAKYANTEPTHYLIKWKDYPEQENTWEPVKPNFTAGACVAEWNDMEHCYGCRWQWEYFLEKPQDGLAAGWHPMPVSVWYKLDLAFRSFCTGGVTKSLEVTCGKYKYNMDFTTMKEENLTHKNHTKRAIRCIPISHELGEMLMRHELRIATPVYP